jgi:radical SAM superfamily enzyme
LQELGFVQRFEAKVTATVAQQIQGDATVELVIVPAFELKKITIITSLAKQ